MTVPSSRRRVAVVGSGVSGLVAAHVLSRDCDVTLIEADDRLGGHADTHDVTLDGHALAVDTGFIVHNERTYPTLLRLFEELGIATQETDMSMSVRTDADNLEYAGGRGLSGLLPSVRTVGRPRYLRMLVEVTRFHKAAQKVLDAASGDGVGETIEEFLDRGRFSSDFRRWFMTPLVAAVWSCEPDLAGRYPARHLFTFLHHHGMLGVLGSPSWRTVVGGSRVYVEAVAERLAEVRLSSPVESVRELPDGVELRFAGGERAAYDAVVLATHAPTALRLLADPTADQARVLGAIPYSRNIARLHTDDSVLPRNHRARASWNYLVPDSERPGEVVVSYDMTRLQRLPVVGGKRLIVTLGGADLVDPRAVLATMDYEHPLFTAESVAAQAELPSIATDRVAFAGAYHGWGFHEDGALSGLRAAERLGGAWTALPAADAPAPLQHPVLPRIYETSIKHARTEPVDHRFAYSSYTWLVDLDHLPEHGVLGRFEARDHIGDPGATIRDNLDRFLAAQGVDLQGGQILMLANARVAGHCFNPISIHWCHDRSGALECVVIEVHNTYGDRHAYLVRPDEHGNATTDKALYVSPFNDVSGSYRLHVPEPGDRLEVSVTLDREGRPPFVATVRGTAAPATLASLRRIALRHPLEPLVVAARIRKHGISLWRKGLKVAERPVHPNQQGTEMTPLTAVPSAGPSSAATVAPSVEADLWPDVARVPSGVKNRVAAVIAERLLRAIARTLNLRMTLPDGSLLGRRTADRSLPELRIVRPEALFRRIGDAGLIGFGEAYMAGDWEADDLTAVLSEFARRVDRLVPVPLQRLRTAYVARHPGSEINTVENTRNNISRHYDLSNDLFATFLDPSMTYSSALFANRDLSGEDRPTRTDLVSAQHAKIDRLLDHAGVTEGTRLLEIGTGWGELAIRAARRGAVVHSVTLSSEQRDLARRRVARAGLTDLVSIELSDYRDVQGEYDAVVSVEMIEAVGIDFLPTYFATIDRVLAPGGRVALQAITMADHRLRATRDTYTWVHKYIFPGGLIPSVESIERSVADTGLRLAEDFAMGQHYAETLRLWDEEFLRRWPEVSALGFDEVFRRMWHFYLCYSRAGFATSYLDVRQLAFARPGEASVPVLPSATTPYAVEETA